MEIRKLGRTIQTNFSFLQDLKFSILRFARKSLEKPDEADFKAIKLLNGIDNNLFLDVGANRGQSIDAMLMFNNKLTIQSFEPNPLLCDKLAKVYGTNKNVTIHGYGLGDEAGEFTLYVPFYKNYMFDGLASFNEVNAKNWLRSRIYHYNEKYLTIKKITCRVKRLDDLELRPFFIKLDVQGYELPALKGAEQTLGACKPVLLIESPENEIQDYLLQFGYKKYAFRDNRFVLNGKSLPNSFFITDDKLSLFYVDKN